MNTTALRRESSIIPLTAAADQTDKEGFFVEVSSGNASICNAATDVPLGVIVQGAGSGELSSIAVPGGLPGTVAVKLAGTISAIGTLLQLTATGEVIADAGTGARVLVARALETGVDDEKIEAVLFNPVVYAS